MKKRSLLRNPLAKTLLSLTLVLPLLSPVADASAAASPKITVSIDGQLQSYDQPPLIVGNRVLVPLRGIFEALGASVEWHAKQRLITAKRGSTELRLEINRTYVWINGSPDYVMDVAPQIYNDRAYVPIRFISEMVGADVKWDGAKRAVSISKDKVKLLDAIEYKNQPEVTRLLGSGIDPNSVRAYGDNAVGFALAKGNLEAVKLLLQHGADKDNPRISLAIQGNSEQIKVYLNHYQAQANQTRFAKNEFLFYTITGNKTQALRSVLAAGVDVNAPLSRPDTPKHFFQIPLFYTLFNHNTEILHDLLEAGADPNLPITAPGYRTHALFYGADKNNTAQMRELLNHGAKPDQQDGNGWTPLMVAADNGHSSAVELLLEKGANPNLKNNLGATALMIAEAHGNSQVVAKLLSAGAQKTGMRVEPQALTLDYALKTATSKYYTPLTKAVYLGHTGDVKKLLATGADPNQKTEDSPYSAVHMAANIGNLEMIEALLTGPVPVSQSNKNRLLHIAISTSNLELAKLALKHGAQTKGSNEYGESLAADLLHTVSEQNNLDGLRFLLENGIEVKDYNQSTSAMQIAAHNGHNTAMQLLLSAIQDEKYRQSEGRNALIESIHRGNTQGVRTLIDLGVSVNFENDQKQTPLQLATKFGYQEIIGLLTQAGATK